MVAEVHAARFLGAPVSDITCDGEKPKIDPLLLLSLYVENHQKLC